MIPSPLITLRHRILSIEEIAGTIGPEAIVVGRLPIEIKNQMPRMALSIQEAGLIDSSPENKYWRWRIQTIVYAPTQYQAHKVTLGLIEGLHGMGNFVVEALDNPEGIRARITNIEHMGGPIALDDIDLQNMSTESTFWAVGAIRAET